MKKRRLWKSAEYYSKTELDSLISWVAEDDPEAIEEAIAFTISESFGIWHGRARAKICRTLKNHPPSDALQRQLVDAIANRLESGRFSEQFKDQLRMAIRFDSKRMQELSTCLVESPKGYVRRYARWVLQLIRSTSSV